MCTACLQMAAVDRARSSHATVEAAGRHACQLGWRSFFFFFGSADPRIFEDSNGSSADPDRSGFRWIRFIPTSYVLLTSSIFLHAQFLFLHGGSLGKMSDPVRSVIPDVKALTHQTRFARPGGSTSLSQITSRGHLALSFSSLRFRH